MIDALNISESGLKATQQWVDQISHHIANMQTPGYKKTDVYFSDLVSSQASQANSAGSANATNALNKGIGTRIDAPRIDFSEGAFRQTNRELDLAITGSGFFELVGENGEAVYTRQGSLIVDSEGYLSHRDGLRLSDQIQVPADASNIEIASSGEVRATLSGQADVLSLGQISIATITNTDSLTSLGAGLFSASDTSTDVVLARPNSDGAGALTQGYLEMANVELVDEMTNLVLAQRVYQLNARIIQTADQIMETVNNLKR